MISVADQNSNHSYPDQGTNILQSESRSKFFLDSKNFQNYKEPFTTFLKESFKNDAHMRMPLFNYSVTICCSDPDQKPHRDPSNSDLGPNFLNSDPDP